MEGYGWSWSPGLRNASRARLVRIRDARSQLVEIEGAGADAISRVAAAVDRLSNHDAWTAINDWADLSGRARRQTVSAIWAERRRLRAERNRAPGSLA
jgi:hypothetical protein